MKIVLEKILQVFLGVILLIIFLIFLVAIYYLGMMQGYRIAVSDVEGQLESVLEEIIVRGPFSPLATPTSEATPTPISPAPEAVAWGGPELWAAVNKRRGEFGVNSLSQKDELCTIASLRLNELLTLGTLDGHEGFGNLAERRPDLEWIFEKYSNISEFLALGGQTPQETVAMWENTLGHKKLLIGGEYVWGCIYAQNTFAVAIIAF